MHLGHLFPSHLEKVSQKFDMDERFRDQLAHIHEIRFNINLVESSELYELLSTIID